MIHESLLTSRDEIASPYLPGTNIQYAFDSTSLGLLKTCPRLYQLTMIEGWTPHDQSIHLTFGIEYHQALQEYEIARAAGASHNDAIHQVVHDLLIRTKDWIVPDTSTKAGRYKNRESVLRTVIWYLDHYQHDEAKTYILEDGRPAVELSFRFELDFGPDPSQPYLLSGHLDRVVSFQDNLFVMDHKTTTSTPGPYYFNQYEPNNQMSLYTFASQVVIKSPVKGVIISAAQILSDSCRFVRGFTYRTADQIEEWVRDLRHWFGLAKVYAESDYWPMNDTACDKFGGCRFREICSKSPQVREIFLASNFTKQSSEDRWNPLKAR